jgi:hypothetical protein
MCTRSHFLISLKKNIFCISLKKRLPVIAGHSLLLISVARQLFSHVWEVVKDGPSFQLEYSMILRQLLAVKEYRYQMKPRTYISEFPYPRCCVLI